MDLNLKKLVYVFYLCIGFAVISCNSVGDSNTDCELYRKGNFKYHWQGMNFLVERNDSIQIEKIVGTNYIMKLKLKWIDKCKYEVVFLESNYPFSDSISVKQKTEPIEVEILSGNSIYYLYTAKRKSGKVVSDTVWVDYAK
ncbi:MAG: hypothetical protein IPG89_20405 [Bacteroidetes bacterium]|nr:hypothetical protein [Bacteroidota bacterium]